RRPKPVYFWTILWRCCGAAELGIARLGNCGDQQAQFRRENALDGWGSAIHVRRDKAALFQWVQAPPGDRSSRNQPEQAWRRRLKPSDNGHDFGDRASVQAATRVNAEQSSKRTM